MKHLLSPGSAANPGKVTISVGGMTCAACVRRVENALKEVDGVQDASVNLATARATVTHASQWGGFRRWKKQLQNMAMNILGEIKDSFDDPIEKPVFANSRN